MGGSATPALLFSLGIMLSYQDKIAPTKLIVSMTTIKLILHPILAWFLIAFLLVVLSGKSLNGIDGCCAPAE